MSRYVIGRRGRKEGRGQWEREVGKERRKGGWKTAGKETHTRL